MRTIEALPNGDERMAFNGDANDAILSQKDQLQRNYTFGRRTIEVIEDPDGANVKTTYAYRRPLAALMQKLTEGACGWSWARYEYDSRGRKIKNTQFSGWKDAPSKGNRCDRLLIRPAPEPNGLTLQWSKNKLGMRLVVHISFVLQMASSDTHYLHGTGGCY